jgi:hypothetical protein
LVTTTYTLTVTDAVAATDDDTVDVTVFTTVTTGNGKLISGAAKDEATGHTVHRIIIAVAGASGSTVSLYDGPVTGTPFLVIPGTTIGNWELNVFCAAGAHVVTVDSGGTLRTTVLYK